MILIKNYNKNQSDRYPFFPHNDELPDFSYKLPHFKISDVLSIFIIEVLIETIVSEF